MSEENVESPVTYIEKAVEMLNKAIEMTRCPVCREEISIVKKAAEQLKDIIQIAEVYADAVTSAKELNELIKRLREPRRSALEDVTESIRKMIEEEERELVEAMHSKRDRGKRTIIDEVVDRVTSLLDSLIPV